MRKRADQLRKQVQIQDALLTRTAERSFRAFVEQAWPILEPDVPFIPNWHIDLICETLQLISEGKGRNLVVNMPPRYMKSMLISVLWPAWEWISHPGGRWIFCSYAEALATKLSLDRRRLITSDWFQRRWGHRVQLAPDQNVKDEFQNTRHGLMVATSVAGSITGKGGSRIVVDDPHSPGQAASDLQREATLAFFRSTLFTRLDNKKDGRIVVTGQRLHTADLSAFCIGLGFDHVSLPAEAESPTTFEMPISHKIITRAPGGLLWPDREGRTELDAQKLLLGSAVYAAQYQQCPAPPGGLIFNPAWLKYYDECPPLEEMAQSWDMTFKGNEDSDYVVGLVGGRRGADIILIDRVKGRYDFMTTCREVEAMWRRYPDAHAIYVEDAANGPAIVNSLGRRVPGIIAVTPQGGKMARAIAAQPLVEAGNIWLPNPYRDGHLIPGRAWVEDFVLELSRFPNGAHDDDVDAFTQLVAQWLSPQVNTDLVWGR